MDERVSMGNSWSPDGSEIFYRGSDQNQMMVVAVETDPTFEAGRARALFDDLYYAVDPGDPHYDISRDGKRFLMIGEDVVEDGAPTKIMVTLNWFQELERLVRTESTRLNDEAHPTELGKSVQEVIPR